MPEDTGAAAVGNVDPAPPDGAKTWNVERFDGQRWIGVRFRGHGEHSKRYHSTELLSPEALDTLDAGTYRIGWRGADSRTLMGHSEPFVVEDEPDDTLQAETPEADTTDGEDVADAEPEANDELPPLGPVPMTADVPDELLAMDRGIHLVLRVYQMLQRDTKQTQLVMTQTFRFAIEAERKRTQEFIERIEVLHRRERDLGESELLERLEKLEASGDFQAAGLTPEAQAKIGQVVGFLKPIGEAILARAMQGQLPSEKPSGGNTHPDTPSG